MRQEFLGVKIELNKEDPYLLYNLTLDQHVNSDQHWFWPANMGDNVSDVNVATLVLDIFG